MMPSPVEALALEMFQEAAQLQSLPGVSFALIHDGRVYYAGGVGETSPGSGVLPDEFHMYRIASMTKSFTAAALMLLRDRGVLSLDDPLVRFLPRFKDPIGGPQVLVRDALTMTAGLPTDDPWGDRLESLSLQDFDMLVARGLSFTRPPRTGYEYSNLGYALLGRVISSVSGVDYLEFIKNELLTPLALSATCFDSVDAGSLLLDGYTLREGSLVLEPRVSPGAFSPMGGLHSSVLDVSTWVRCFLSAWAPLVQGPLDRWSLREMMEPKAFISTSVLDPLGDIPARALSRAYGYGVGVLDDSLLGRFNYHNGGYPGYGSTMLWHPGTGWGVVALSNRTYADLSPVAFRLLSKVIYAEAPISESQSSVKAILGPVSTTLWAETQFAMDACEGLVARWDEVSADRVFALNMDQDQPRDLRQAELNALALKVGVFRRVEGSVKVVTPAQVSWRVAGPFGVLQFEILMTPEQYPQVQKLTVFPVPDA